MEGKVVGLIILLMGFIIGFVIGSLDATDKVEEEFINNNCRVGIESTVTTIDGQTTNSKDTKVIICDK